MHSHVPLLSAKTQEIKNGRIELRAGQTDLMKSRALPNRALGWTFERHNICLREALETKLREWCGRFELGVKSRKRFIHRPEIATIVDERVVRDFWY